jgi:hypothetical protein
VSRASVFAIIDYRCSLRITLVCDVRELNLYLVIKVLKKYNMCQTHFFYKKLHSAVRILSHQQHSDSGSRFTSSRAFYCYFFLDGARYFLGSFCASLLATARLSVAVPTDRRETDRRASCRIFRWKGKARGAIRDRTTAPSTFTNTPFVPSAPPRTQEGKKL